MPSHAVAVMTPPALQQEMLYVEAVHGQTSGSLAHLHIKLNIIRGCWLTAPGRCTSR